MSRASRTGGCAEHTALQHRRFSSVEPGDPPEALRGETLTSLELMSGEELEREQAGLAEKAFLVLEETPYAKPTLKNEETRGMVLIGAMPIKRGAEIIGGSVWRHPAGSEFCEGGRIAAVVFQQQDPQSTAARGTVHYFLGDTRITTTVRDASGNRAINCVSEKSPIAFWKMVSVGETGRLW